jgi:glutamate carboxypeptidase
MTDRLDAFLGELHRWVSLETPSIDRKAVADLGDIVAISCAEADLSVERVTLEGGSPDLILARGGPNIGEPGILVLAHLDTVHPIGTLARSLPWRRDGDRLHGPGIYDMKASALMALEAWRRLSMQGRRPASAITFLFSPDEEIGSPASRPLIESEARRAFATLVVEPARNGGKIVVGRKGVARFNIVVSGVAAHSGGYFENGRSAISEMARQIPVLESLTDLAAGVTVNVGTIKGGTSPNTVPAECSIEVDVRLQRMDQVDSILEVISSLRPIGCDVTVKVSGGLNRPPFFPDEGSRALFAHARTVACGCGIDLVGIHSGGASDGNFTSALGIPTLDGLGVDGNGAHTLDEHILVSSVLPRTDLFAELLATTTRNSTFASAAA